MQAGLYSQLVGWVGNIILAVILIRGLRARLVVRYPAFYSYVSYVLLISAAALWVLARYATHYWTFYWVSEFIALLMGIAVTLEIYHHGLQGYAGVRKLADALLMGLSGIAAVRACASGMLAATLYQLERDLRGLQLVILILFCVLMVYYSIPVGRNLKGITIGYMLFVCTTLLNLTFRAQLGPAFQATWAYAQPVEYCGIAAIWCAFLWSRHNEPRVTASMSTDEYGTIAAQTELSLTRLGSQMNRASI